MTDDTKDTHPRALSWHHLGNDMKITQETITPSIAARLLERNPMNRNLRLTVVNGYARDMKSGRWQVNGDAIRLNNAGELIDGQHRLSACVKSGVPFHTVVIRGVDDDARATIDGGAKRKHGDRLQMRGVENASQISSTLRMLYGLATGDGYSANNTSQELDAIFQAHPDVAYSVQKMCHAFRGLNSPLCAAHYIATWSGHGDRAMAMHEVWSSGVPDYAGDPMHLVRERIIRTQGTPTELARNVKLRLLCRAYPAFLRSEPVKVVRPSDKIGIPGWAVSDIGLMVE